jgi:large subunit ribosomal protein L2
LAKLYHPTSDDSSKISYILAPKGLKIFDKIRSLSSDDKNIFLKQGDRTTLSNFESGDLVHAVENIPGKGAMFARAAGTFCQVLQHDSKEYSKVRLPSGSQRLIPVEAKATYGILANEKHNQRIIGKAGRSR